MEDLKAAARTNPEGTDLERLPMLSDEDMLRAVTGSHPQAVRNLRGRLAFLRARAEKAESALAQAIAERDRMAEALKPFAKLRIDTHADDPESTRYVIMPYWQGCVKQPVWVGAIRRASQALTTTPEAEPRG